MGIVWDGWALSVLACDCPSYPADVIGISDCLTRFTPGRRAAMSGSSTRAQQTLPGQSIRHLHIPLLCIFLLNSPAHSTASQVPHFRHSLGVVVTGQFTHQTKHSIDSPLFISSTMVQLRSEHVSIRLPYWPSRPWFWIRRPREADADA